MPRKALLIYAAPEIDADLLYASKFSAPDPFIWWSVDGENHAVLSPLEIDRARSAAGIHEVHAAEEFVGKRVKQKTPAVIIAAIAKKQSISEFLVPESFPSGLLYELKAKRVKIKVKKARFFPNREIKTADEIRMIEAAQRIGEAGLFAGLKVLKSARIRTNGSLSWKGRRLTSELVRGEIDAEIVRRGGLPAGTIVAGGDQACDPHERGSGFLRAHELIIMDVFPRDQRTGYFGDLTRTVVRGKATAEMKKLYRTVADGQAWAKSKMKSGVDGKKLHNDLVKRFEAAGFPTEQREGRWVGFFHGTGHSLGLEIHEPPRFAAGKFRAGHVMTVEPGLYYPGLGGVRLEDLVVVQSKGIKNLTKVPQRLEI